MRPMGIHTPPFKQMNLVPAAQIVVWTLFGPESSWKIIETFVRKVFPSRVASAICFNKFGCCSTTTGALNVRLGIISFSISSGFTIVSPLIVPQFKVQSKYRKFRTNKLMENENSQRFVENSSRTYEDYLKPNTPARKRSGMQISKQTLLKHEFTSHCNHCCIVSAIFEFRDIHIPSAPIPLFDQPIS
jgi:hypothetical protein